ncbi:hypothetical protein ACFE04_013503 [Oxalis oulophora]
MEHLKIRDSIRLTDVSQTLIVAYDSSMKLAKMLLGIDLLCIDVKFAAGRDLRHAQLGKGSGPEASPPAPPPPLGRLRPLPQASQIAYQFAQIAVPPHTDSPLFFFPLPLRVSRHCQDVSIIKNVDIKDLKRGFVASNSKDDPAKESASFFVEIKTKIDRRSGKELEKERPSYELVNQCVDDNDAKQVISDLLLKALGAPTNAPIYSAGGEPFRGSYALQPLVA